MIGGANSTNEEVVSIFKKTARSCHFTLEIKDLLVVKKQKLEKR